MLGEDSISTDDEDLLRHGYSEWSTINIDQLPVAVAYPKSTEEVSLLARVCYKYKIPMSAYIVPFQNLDTDAFSSLFGWIESGSKFLCASRWREHRFHFHGPSSVVARRRVSVTPSASNHDSV